MKEITIPNKLLPLVQAFSATSKAAVHALISEAAKMIGERSDFDCFGSKKEVSEDDVEAISALMEGIEPKNTLEAIYAAQIVASLILGMRKLANGHGDDMRLGLQLLRFSKDSMQQLEKKRFGGSQNINVTYNHNGHGPALVQTVLPDLTKQE